MPPTMPPAPRNPARPTPSAPTRTGRRPCPRPRRSGPCWSASSQPSATPPWRSNPRGWTRWTGSASRHGWPRSPRQRPPGAPHRTAVPGRRPAPAGTRSADRPAGTTPRPPAPPAAAPPGPTGSRRQPASRRRARAPAPAAPAPAPPPPPRPSRPGPRRLQPDAQSPRPWARWARPTSTNTAARAPTALTVPVWSRTRSPRPARACPRTAAEQFAQAPVKVPLSAAQPGDLLVWGSAPGFYHVAIYLGGGRVVQALNPESGHHRDGPRRPCPGCSSTPTPPGTEPDGVARAP